MKNETGKDRIIREYFAQEQIPPQIHQAVLAACASLPERKDSAVKPRGMADRAGKKSLLEERLEAASPVRRNRRTAWKVAASAFGTAAAVFLLLCGVNAVDPAVAENIPVVGEAFRQYNSQKRGRLESQVDAYEVSGTGSQGVEELTLTAKEAYSDGAYLHLSFTLDLPGETWKDVSEKGYRYLTAVVSAEVNGAPLPHRSSLALWPEERGFAGTADLRLSHPAQNGEALEVRYQVQKLSGGYEDQAGVEEFSGEFEGGLSVTVDTGRSFSEQDPMAFGDVRVKNFEANPTCTKITYEIPFWGFGCNGEEIDFPNLYTAGGEPVQRWTYLNGLSPEESWLESREAGTLISTWYFDGLPDGTEQAVLRFFEVDADEDGSYLGKSGVERTAGVLGEATIDVSTGEAVPSETYLDEGLLYASGYRAAFDDLNWSVVFDDIFLRTDLHNFNRESIFAEEDLFQNGYTLEQLNYDQNLRRLTLNFYSTNAYEKDLKVTVEGEDGGLIARGSTRRENVFENDAMTFHDTEEEMREDMEKRLDEAREPQYYPLETSREVEERVEGLREEWERTYPGQYSYKVVMAPLPDREPKALDHATVRITDPDTGEELYARTVRLVCMDEDSLQ